MYASHLSLTCLDGRQEHPSLNAKDVVREYWEGMNRLDGIPRRSDVNPLHFAESLDFAFLLEKPTQGAAQFRMAGSHLADFLGKEVRGLPASTMVSIAQKQTLQDLIELVFTTGKPVFAILRPGDDSQIHAALSVFPLLDDSGNLTRAIGTFQCFGYREVTPLHFTKVTPILTECHANDQLALDEKPQHRTFECKSPAVMEADPAINELNTVVQMPKKKGALKSERPFLRLVN